MHGWQMARGQFLCISSDDAMQCPLHDDHAKRRFANDLLYNFVASTTGCSPWLK
jgi:hypothetical protein